MYESLKTVSELISEIGEQCSNSNSPEVKVSWINEVEQELYSDVIEDYYVETKTITTAASEVPIALTYLVDTKEHAFLFEDIRKVEVKHGTTGKYEEYSVCSLAYVPEYSYFKENDKLNYSDPKNGDSIKIVLRRMPAIKLVANISTDKLSLPDRFLQIYKYYIFAQILQIKKEYDESNNWLALYNAELEDFSAWYLEHKPSYGG